MRIQLAYKDTSYFKLSLNNVLVLLTEDVRNKRIIDYPFPAIFSLPLLLSFVPQFFLRLFLC